jgi:Fe-S-cluster containining protein
MIQGHRMKAIDRVRVFAQENFDCWKCGTCCVDSDPIVIYEADIKDLMKFFKLPRSRIIKKHLTPYGEGRDSCVYKLKHVNPCKFLCTKTMQCKIYEARPIACKLYPFLSSESIEQGTLGYEDCPASVEFANGPMRTQDVQCGLLALDMLPEKDQDVIDENIRKKIKAFCKGMIQ